MQWWRREFFCGSVFSRAEEDNMDPNPFHLDDGNASVMQRDDLLMPFNHVIHARSERAMYV